MRKTLLFIACAICACVCNAQGIEGDVMNAGTRVISGEMLKTRSFKDEVVINVKLTATQNEVYGTKYNFCLQAVMLKPYKINKDAILLLKNSNDEVIELKCNTGADASVRDVHNINGYVYSDYSDFAFYEITPEQIKKLECGVKKIRIGFSFGEHDKEYKKDKMGKGLYSEYLAIEEALKTPKGDF